ncbi:MAG TPA: hypothetical protein VGY91_08290 [Chthoniobacterales bacterium]|jgi:hypothetical protein|nr:hypothetical protein [Chthoniobacterales bacterium]
MNGVADRIEIRDICTWNVLNELRSEKQLLFVDIEGAEMDLLDPCECEALRRSDVTRGRRQQADRSEWIATNRHLWDKRLSEEEVVRATNEFRTGDQVWLWLKAVRDF